MEFNINIGQAGLFVGFCVLLVISVYLIITLSNINKLMVKLNRIIGMNTENINMTCALLPLIATNVNGAAIGIKDGFATVGSAVGTLDESRVETVAAVTAGAENILKLISVAGTLVQSVIHSFTHRKRR